MIGRFINFYKPQLGWLHLCEVKVYGGRDQVHHYMMVNIEMVLILIAQLVEHGINNARIRVFYPPGDFYYNNVCTDNIVMCYQRASTKDQSEFSVYNLWYTHHWWYMTQSIGSIA